MPNFVEVTGMCVVFDKGRELQLAVRMRVGGGRHMPYFEFATEADGEVSTGRRKRECSGGSFEREVVYGDTTGDVCQYGLAIFVDREEQVALGCEPYSRDVLSVGKRECVRLVATIFVSAESWSTFV